MAADQSAGREFGDGARALNRARAYRLIVRLLIDGASAEHLERVGIAAATTDDELAAGHYELFGRQVFPRAGVFLNSDGLAAGAAADLAAASYRRYGFDLATTGESADHLGVELDFLAVLCRLRVRAQRERDGAADRELAAAQRRFLDRCVLSWMVPFAAAVAVQPSSPWTELVGLIVELVADHRGALGGLAVVDAERDGVTSAAEPLDPSASVRAVAETLLRPQRTGSFISRRELAAIGRRFDLPAGFGDRAQLLSNLLRNGAEYDSLARVLAAIDGVAEQRAHDYRKLAEELDLHAAAGPWLQRLAHRPRILI